jgi:saccharopine dehydrogenase-like NADP-dependent oxidoreductase
LVQNIELEEENRMKVLVVGAGAQGGPCASILSRDKTVSKIVLGDIDLSLANEVKEKLRSDKITTVKVDAGDMADIEKAAKGVDVIINLTLTAFDVNIMKTALKVGAHYVDTSFGEPSLMDIRARDNILGQIIEKKPLGLDREFKEAGLTALVGSGASPGIVNILAKYVCDRLDRVDEIRIRLGRKNLVQSTEVVSAWEPTWSPFRALWGYAVEPTIFEGGQYRKYPIFSGYEEYYFPEPVGMIPLVYHQHQEPITLPHFIGKGIRYCDFKYTVDTRAGTLIKTGLANSYLVDVKGVQVAPIDVLMKIVRPPVDSFLSEDENTAKLPPKIVGRLGIEVKGGKGAEDIEYKLVLPLSIFETVEEKLEMYRKFGASNIYVSLPAVVGAKMCVEGNAARGVIAAECLDPVKFLKMMAGMGAPVKFLEVCSKKVVIS